MKIIALRDTVADGNPIKASDKPVEVSDAAARTLIQMGKAVAYEAGAAAPTPSTKPSTTPAGKKTAAAPKSNDKGKDAKPSEGEKSASESKEGGESLEDALEKDPDLGNGQDDDGGQKEASLPDDYQELCALAVDLKIKDPAKIKKDKLIALIKEAQAKAKVQE